MHWYTHKYREDTAFALGIFLVQYGSLCSRICYPADKVYRYHSNLIAGTVL